MRGDTEECGNELVGGVPGRNVVKPESDEHQADSKHREKVTCGRRGMQK